jgi:hypothetical protein
VAINQIALLVDGFGLEEEGTGQKKVSIGALPGTENRVPACIGNLQLNPTLNHVERAVG